MKYISILSIIILFACGNSETSQQKEEQSIEAIDTIAELNTPNNLDSSVHQFFIDTTKNSKYFKQIKNWKPNKFDKQGANFYYHEISKNHTPTKDTIKNFPRSFISIHQFNDQLLSFNPINGINHRFTITDTSIIHYRIEAASELIKNIIKETKNELILELRTIPQIRSNQIEFLRLQRTPIPYIFQASRSTSNNFKKENYQVLYIDLDNLNKLNMLVDDAPFLIHHPIQFQSIDKKLLTTER